MALPRGVVDVDTATHEPDASPWATVLLTHGAGTRFDHPFLLGFADALATAGARCVRFNLPYAQQGRRVPGPAAHAMAGWRAVRDAAPDDAPVFAAGRSYGGRMASMAAADGRFDVAGLVYLGYPLHPPGNPDRLRADHLPAITAPQLFVSGTRDPFVAPHDQLERAVASCPRARLRWIDGGGHGFEVARHCRPAAQIGVEIAAIAAEWMRAQV
ncbi:alpha/beta fold hydrolase [Microbacterium protaetiae]|uniref:alpha/beta hydrolase family protein n=1 Tax=Microbacterium protaetiae TaxID=2509458 RepID=UPI001F5D2121|nr:alpha/beta fold hydrolase [Microbacterium protaetiae]